MQFVIKGDNQNVFKEIVIQLRHFYINLMYCISEYHQKTF